MYILFYCMDLMKVQCACRPGGRAVSDGTSEDTGGFSPREKREHLPLAHLFMSVSKKSLVETFSYTSTTSLIVALFISAISV